MKKNTMKKMNGLLERKKERKRLNKIDLKDLREVDLKEVEFLLKKSHKWK